MALIPGICTQCGATLTADDTKDCMICPYCNTPFIVEKAINNFHNTYNISNSTVNIYSKENDDFVIRAGVLEKYNGSETKVTIPDTVHFIGAQAFLNCYGLTEVIIPEGVIAIKGSALNLIFEEYQILHLRINCRKSHILRFLYLSRSFSNNLISTLTCIIYIHHSATELVDILCRKERF